jgi:hypothetical protein
MPVNRLVKITNLLTAKITTVPVTKYFRTKICQTKNLTNKNLSNKNLSNKNLSNKNLSYKNLSNTTCRTTACSNKRQRAQKLCREKSLRCLRFCESVAGSHFKHSSNAAEELGKFNLLK